MNESTAAPLSLRMRLKQFRRRITYSKPFTAFLSFLAYCLIKMITKTLRIERRVHPDAQKLESPNYLYSCWHGDLFLVLQEFSNEPICLMTAPSWAAEILTGVLLRFGYQVVRGSHKKQAVKAMLEMTHILKKGYIGALALDGPSGPLHRSKPGMIFLAQRLNLPIVPIATSAEHAWVFNSTWDKFYIPKPFSRCALVIGKPIDAVLTEKEFTVDDLDARQNEVAETARSIFA